MTISVVQACDWFDLGAADTAEVVEAAQGIARDPGLARQRDELAGRVRQQMEVPRGFGLVDLPERFDPLRDRDLPATERWFYVVVMAGVLADTLAAHARRGIDPDISRATMADLGRHVRIAYRSYGLRCFERQVWLQAHLRGVLFDQGRLQLNLHTLTQPAELLRAAGLPATTGNVVLDTHIPENGPLTPERVDESLQRAADFYTRHFPEHGPYRVAVCDSWLLDPQLATMLPGSNIARFQQRFTLLDQSRPCDQAALDFVFRAPGTDRSRLPRDTALQRGMLDLLDAGGHIEARVGWLPLPPPD
ncbi:MAG: acyltransferase domain-containing protein [Actinomycetia bacterium]|nr:acyltransferase domain-containing protein [Actinomycetes bacterium]